MSIYIHVCIYLQLFECIVLCVAGGVAVYDAVVCVAVCVAGYVARSMQAGH